MEQKYVLVEYLSSLNNVVSQTFTQRIKLTSFDVSNKFIVFGASSGGIYIFKRNPHKFLKLIPSKEGGVLKIVISPNEKNIALASAKGFIIIVQNFWADITLDYQIYTEHEGLTVTAMKWNHNDLYCGDHTGKVSVISLVNILSKAIFQTPSSVLMQLDSCIVQLDVYSKFLLISTLTRSYLCNTEREEYRQIGKKPRDGPYGACFFNAPQTSESNMESYHSFSGVFKILKDDEKFSELLVSDVKIYCSRPGARLWEASFEASVIVTHQFRSSLKQNPSDLLFIEDHSEAVLKLHQFPNVKSVPNYFNFRKIYPILNRFILTYDSDGIYIFDPKNSCLAFWCNIFNNINDVIITDSLVFIWQNESKINILSLIFIEDLIIKTLLDKQYYLCADLCINFQNEVLDLIIKSKKIHLISVLKDKVEQLDRFEQLKIIFSKIDEQTSKICDGIKLNSGIVVVENAFCHVDKKCVQINENISSNSNKINEQNGKEELDTSINKILEKQFILNKTHPNVEIIDLTKLYTKSSLNELVDIFEKFVEFIREKLNENCTKWIQMQYLKQASRKINDLSQLEDKHWLFLKDAFLNVNLSEQMKCECNFPLPKAHLERPQFYNLSEKLMEKYKNSQDILNKVPYLNKFYLENAENVDENLCLLIQFSDEEIFKKFLQNFSYDTWDETVKNYLKLMNGNCLNCGCNIDNNGIINWSQIGMIMIQSIGAPNTIKLLQRYIQNIKSGDLNAIFFQTCIFSTALNNLPPTNTVGFMEKVINNENNSAEMFEKMMEKYLQKKYLGENLTERLMPSGNNMASLKCTYCQLPLNANIIQEFKNLSCGHVYHIICLQMINNMCNVCVEIL